MKKTLLILLFSPFAFGQNKAVDTTLVNGTQPATILKLSNHKVFIVQNKELETPYKLQTDGSFISNGKPYMKIWLDKKKYSTNLNKLVDLLFDTVPLKNDDNKEIIKVDGIDVFLKTSYDKAEKRIHKMYYYPVGDQFIGITQIVNYKDEESRFETEKSMLSMVENGLLILQDFYLKRKS
ncbi:hypothetical protein OMO38_10370 [Chryseobacterium sp. 09-1422]|uniref:Uncharacterized protein n=1 Tax=Chryseobacterium kimseyorum TaxID=2984028 RepID=A0ABT3HYP6_9FLAO|nr:hypothetical protein [Chryseobacterium kimseyorum]MCW3168926.1 hypothetical protein [Chryseobacterium kimseyorum]